VIGIVVVAMFCVSRKRNRRTLPFGGSWKKK
jgi:hypothetical protein